MTKRQPCRCVRSPNSGWLLLRTISCGLQRAKDGSCLSHWGWLRYGRQSFLRRSQHWCFSAYPAATEEPSLPTGSLMSNVCRIARLYDDEAAWPMSYSSSYWVWSHSSGRLSRTALTPLLAFPEPLPLPPLAVPVSLRENKSTTESVAMVWTAELSEEMTALAVFSLNCCNPRIFSSTVFFDISR